MSLLQEEKQIFDCFCWFSELVEIKVALEQKRNKVCLFPKYLADTFYPLFPNKVVNNRSVLYFRAFFTQHKYIINPILMSKPYHAFSPGLPHFQEQNDLKGLLENLHQNIQAKKRKNVEIMWLAATVSSLVSNSFSWWTNFHMPADTVSAMDCRTMSGKPKWLK